MTGNALYLLLQQHVGQSYSGYLDSFKADRLFREAHIKALEIDYKKPLTQSQKDSTTSLLTTNLVMVPNKNTLSTQSQLITNITVGSATTFVVTTQLNTQLINGQVVIITGVAGTLTMNTANGTFVVSSVSFASFVITVASATGVYTANTGQVLTTATLPKYWHLLALKCKYIQPDYTWTITNITGNAVPIIVTLNTFNPYRTGDQITIAGALGNTNANGTFYIRMVNRLNIQLYSDTNLSVPIIGNADWTTGGSLSKVYYKYAFPFVSEQKISSITIPTVQNPAFETSQNLITIYPLAPACVEATVDYVTTPLQQIVSLDTTIDLLLYYPENFLLYVVDTAGQLFSEQVRDRENVEFEATEKIQNSQ